MSVENVCVAVQAYEAIKRNFDLKKAQVDNTQKNLDVQKAELTKLEIELKASEGRVASAARLMVNPA